MKPQLLPRLAGRHSLRQCVSCTSPTARPVPQVDYSQEPICALLAQLQPVALEPVDADTQEARRLAFYLDRFHYLGWQVVGENMAFLARGKHERDLACSLAPRLGGARRATSTWAGAKPNGAAARAFAATRKMVAARETLTGART
jgi:hypothetical protein